MTTPAQTPDLSDFTPDSNDTSDFTPDPGTKPDHWHQWMTNPSSVPNARIRNLPNPAEGLSPGQALYEGAKTGLTLGSIPASASMNIPTLAGSIVGGTVGNVGGSTIAKAAGAGPFGQEVAGDVGGLVGGLYGAGKFSSAAEQFINNLRAGMPPPSKPIYPGAPFPDNPGMFPGAPLPSNPPLEYFKAMGLRTGGVPGSNQSDVLGNIRPPTTPEGIAAQRYQAVPLEVQQKIPLPNITPTKAATVDPYRQQILPPMTKGVSGNVEAHSYDPGSNTMYTHFKSGDIYKYEGVPKQVYNQFQNAESQGSFHYNNIRGRYETTKIGKVAPTRGR